MPPYSLTECYSSSSSQASWFGAAVEDDEHLKGFFAGPVRDRLRDVELADEFGSELQALSTTGLGAATVARVLNAAEGTSRQPWEVGEALADCLLQDNHDLHWPWNMERDKRTPKASLPGADLIGFAAPSGPNSAVLAVGEVKTSSDAATPPHVMTGRTGMVQQLERFQASPELQATVLKWLRVRCHDTDFWPYYQAAVKRYLDSGGLDIVLVGALMRDTEPNVLDLEARGNHLGGQANAPLRYELRAWYLPHKVETWPNLADGT